MQMQMQMLKTPTITIRGMVFLKRRRGQQTPSDISPLGQWACLCLGGPIIVLRPMQFGHHAQELLFHTRARACIVNYYGPRPSTSKTLLVVMKSSKIVQSYLKQTGCEIFRGRLVTDFKT